MAKKITIELIIPDNVGNGDTDLIHETRETFHNNFTRNPDYVDSNVVVHDNRNGSEEFTETGLVVDFTKCKDRITAATALMNIFEEFIHLPEFVKMVHDNKNLTTDLEHRKAFRHDAESLVDPVTGLTTYHGKVAGSGSLEEARNAIVDEICMEFEKGMNKHE
jgi:hypothetical protein